MSVLEHHEAILPVGRQSLHDQLLMYPYPVLRKALLLSSNPRYNVGKEIAESGSLISMSRPPVALWLGWMDTTLNSLMLIRPPQQLWNAFDWQCHIWFPITDCQPSTH